MVYGTYRVLGNNITSLASGIDSAPDQRVRTPDYRACGKAGRESSRSRLRDFFSPLNITGSGAGGNFRIVVLYQA